MSKGTKLIIVFLILAALAISVVVAVYTITKSKEPEKIPDVEMEIPKTYVEATLENSTEVNTTEATPTFETLEEAQQATRDYTQKAYDKFVEERDTSAISYDAMPTENVSDTMYETVITGFKEFAANNNLPTEFIRDTFIYDSESNTIHGKIKGASLYVVYSLDNNEYYFGDGCDIITVYYDRMTDEDAQLLNDYQSMNYENPTLFNIEVDNFDGNKVTYHNRDTNEVGTIDWNMVINGDSNE